MSPGNQRPLFLPGALLQAEDLSLQQEYQLTQDRTANQGLHTWGITEGLELRASGTNLVSVNAGMALDSLGRQLVLSAPVTVDLQALAESELYITVRYDEAPVSQVGDAQGTWFLRTRVAPRVRALAAPPDDASVELVLGSVTLSVYREVVAIDVDARRYSSLVVGTLAFTNPTTSPARLWAGPEAGALHVEAPKINLLGSAAIQGALGVGVGVPTAGLDVVGAGQSVGRGSLVLTEAPSAGRGLQGGRLTAYGNGTAFSTELRVGDVLRAGAVQAIIEEIHGANVLTLGRLGDDAAPGGETPFQIQTRLLARIAQGNGQPVLAVTAEGRVGIGTETPEASVHVAHGDVRLDGGAAVRFLGGGQIWSGDPSAHAITFLSTGGLTLRDTGDLLLTSGAPDATHAPTLTVSGGRGFVGIGTRVPVDALTVNGIIDATGGLIFPDGSEQTVAVVPIPIGTIVDAWRPPDSSQVILEGFQICDGSTVTHPDSPLVGQRLPDLRDLFVRSVSSYEEIGTTGGEEEHTHDVVLQVHTHSIHHQHDIQAQFDPTPQNSGTILSQKKLALAEHIHKLDNALTLPPTPTESSEYVGGEAVQTQKASAVPPFMSLLKLMRII
ncbi:hypothetical protein D7V97_05050 [Corallococcus sp. CA053C]|uniref:hypothetical protein n=1 Tax=Corallococcus sp. CA053C TaxID=2316732 RepID=UPI000EA1511C|nr:hypothetical protein [Corallococcus sp. CA053C]RKH13584.1 hypothetical protein D7V97_05050 [Corallococcus sp. CA053C]